MNVRHVPYNINIVYSDASVLTRSPLVNVHNYLVNHCVKKKHQLQLAQAGLRKTHKFSFCTNISFSKEYNIYLFTKLSGMHDTGSAPFTTKDTKMIFQRFYCFFVISYFVFPIMYRLDFTILQ